MELNELLAGFGPKQLEYIETPNTRLNFVYGSVSSGKTYATIIKWLLSILKTKEPYLHALAGYSHTTVESNILEILIPILDQLNEYNIIKYRKKGWKLHINNQTVYIVGMNSINSDNRIRGKTLKSALCDEINLWNQDGFKMLLSRLRTPDPFLIATFNPGSPNDFIQEFIKDNTNNDYYQEFKFLLEDNPTLDKDYISYLKQVYGPPDSVFYKRFILGESTAADGLIYTGFDNNNISTLTLNDWILNDKCYIGCDYGPVKGCCFQFFIYRNTKLYMVDEVTYTESDLQRMEDNDIIDVLDKRKWFDYMLDRVYLPHDASNLKKLFQKRGINTSKYMTNRLNDILTINTNFATNRLMIGQQCKETLKSISNYVWDTKAALKGESKPNKTNGADHLMDCMTGPATKVLRKGIFKPRKDENEFVEEIFKNERIKPWRIKND